MSMKKISNDGTESYFDGGLLELIGTRILAIFVTVFTCGICYPWGLCMLYRYETRHTVVNGKRLDFDGSAVGLFGQWIKMLFLIAITFGIYSFWADIAIKKWKTMHTYFAGTR